MTKINIFYLSKNPAECARFHNDKHLIKMILEYSQLLSTAHRVLDGTLIDGYSASGRKKKVYVLTDSRDPNLESRLYSATHVNHPSAIWVRECIANYSWLHSLLVELCKEYTFRYGKVHKCERDGLVDALATYPKNLKVHMFTEPTPAMPDDVKVLGNSLESYRNYYIKNKSKLASWSGKINSRPIPEWYEVNNATL